MRRIAVFLISIFFPFILNSQELKCSVSVVSREIQGTNRQVYQTLQTALYEFMNNTVWTNHVYDIDERIECTFLLNITDQVSADEFKGTLQVQSSRPVYNSNYTSAMFNYKDEDLHFRYVEFQPLEFSESTYLSSITSIMAYYAYLILGFDYDSFSMEGGSEYFKKAENIVGNAQNAVEKGWRSIDSRTHKNRYWIINNILDSKYAPLREFSYRYHRLGLDRMDKNTTEARAEISDALKLLQKVYREKPDPYLQYLKILMGAKSDELINVFSEGFPEEKNRVIQILSEIDPSNATKYAKIKGGS